MQTIRTGRVDLVSRSTSVEIWNPMTGPLASADLKEIRFNGIWLSGLGALKARPGIQFSDDGINWSDAAIGVDLSAGTPYASAIGWTFGNGTWQTVSGLGSTRRLFARVGLLTLNTSGSLAEGGQGDLVMQVKPTTTNTVTAGPVRVWCTGTTAIFIPLTGPVNAADISEIRGSVEMAATSGQPGTSQLGLQCAWQQADTPSVTANWSAATGFGVERTTNGINFATDFTTPSGVTKQYLRFGVLARNLNTTAIEACLATIRVDTRG